MKLYAPRRLREGTNVKRSRRDAARGLHDASHRAGSFARPHRRRARPRGRVATPLGLRVLIVVLVVGALGGAGYLLWSHFSSASRAKAELGDAIDCVAQADAAIVPLNEAVSSQIGGDTSSHEGLSEKIDFATSLLTEASSHLERAQALADHLDDSGREVLDALSASIEARRGMIGAGEVIVDVDDAVSSALGLLGQARDRLESADEKAKSASDAANEYARFLAGEQTQIQDANVAVSLDNEAASLIAEASDLLGKAKQAFGDADYAVYESYVAKRAEAAQLMLDADSAVVSGDFERAGQLVSQYNAADAEAATFAATLPANLSDIFVDSYARLTSAERQKYAESAAKAADADAVVRKYQGVLARAATSGAAPA